MPFGLIGKLGWKKGKSRPMHELSSEPDIDELLLLARRQLDAANASEAEEIVNRALTIQAENIDAIYLLAWIKVLQNRHSEAVELFSAIISRSPKFAHAYTDLAKVQVLLGRTAEAEVLYKQALDIDPDLLAANLDFGILLLTSDRHRLAIPYLQRATVISPDSLTAFQALGDAQARDQHFHEAIHALQTACQLAPNDWRNFCNLAKLHGAVGDRNLAIANYEKARSLNFDIPEVHYELGLLLSDNDQIDDAIDAIITARQLGWDAATCALKLSGFMFKNGRLEEAASLLESQIGITPDNPDLLCMLGQVYAEQERHESAVTYFERALTFRQSFAQAWNNLSFSLSRLDRYQASIDAATRAIEIAPSLAKGYYNRGFAQANLAQFKPALADLSRALELDPELTTAHWSLSQAWLIQGNFEMGWPEYEHRFSAGGILPRIFPYPRWAGEPLSGKTLLIFAEQGLGDEIMFSSCLPDVIDQAKNCVVECEPRLAKLLQRSFPSALVLGKEREKHPTWLDELPPIDLCIPLGSLPLHLRRQWSEFPQHTGYLSADSALSSAWLSRLSEIGPGLKIGISWRGGLARTRQHLRSIPLADWLPVLRTPNAHFVSLQYGDCAAELAELKSQHGLVVHAWPELLADIDQLAALIESLDLVISVCNSTVHMAGALGKPAWALVPIFPEWRYLVAGEKMPWYPSVQLIRQAIPGDWKSVLQGISSKFPSY